MTRLAWGMSRRSGEGAVRGADRYLISWWNKSHQAWLWWDVVYSVQFSSVNQLCPTLCEPMDCSMPGFPVHHQFPELLKLMSIELAMPSNHLILCCPLLLLPSIFPRIRIFSNESVLGIRWSKYWSFSFSISPSNEYSGLISFRMGGLYLLGVSRVFSNTTV